MTTIRLHDVRVVFREDSRGRSALPLFNFNGLFGGSRRPQPEAMQMPEPPRSVALDGVNLEIRHGETMGILGPSGCGKSTLLRAIAGLVPLESGLITYDGRDMTEVPPGDRRIGIVFQNYALYPTMTSSENVGFYFHVHQRDEEIPERIRHVSDVMGIGFEKLLGRYPGKLSGGERQRVAVARCIARDPGLFLFDEPFSNLDAKLRVQTRVELKKLIIRYKVTGVYVTHDQTEALSLCDRIAIMYEGKIEQVGTAKLLLERPGSLLVATFFGHPPMNLFEGVVVDGQFMGRQFSLPLGGHDVGENRKITLGIRAEHLHLDPDAELRGEVALVEPIPTHRTELIYIETRDSRVAVEVPIGSGLRIGNTVGVKPDPEYSHIFDTRTGRRL